MAHTIRLRGPWNIRFSGFDVPKRFHVPGPLPPGPGQLGAELTRSFQKPTGLDEQTRVRLRGRLAAESFDILLNGQRLATDCRAEFAVDIARHLHESNLLVLRCSSLPPSTENLILEVWLEIE